VCIPVEGSAGRDAGDLPVALGKERKVLGQRGCRVRGALFDRLRRAWNRQEPRAEKAAARLGATRAHSSLSSSPHGQGAGRVRPRQGPPGSPRRPAVRQYCGRAGTGKPRRDWAAPWPSRRPPSTAVVEVRVLVRAVLLAPSTLKLRSTGAAFRTGERCCPSWRAAWAWSCT
jgi:hypothetical protein